MNDVTQWMVDQLVSKEHQYANESNLPMDSIKMAWPFKTEKERELIKKWMRKQTKNRKVELLQLEQSPF